MNRKLKALLGVFALVLALLACNLPSRSAGGGEATELPALNQTLTALFAITPINTATATLPPIFTATDSQSGGGVNPTATQPAATATQAPTGTATALPTVVVTPLATATRPPQPTATTRIGRKSTFAAQYLSSAPDIDGDWGEWKAFTREYPANFVTWGAGNHTGEEDLSSSFHIGWDADNLYVAVKVHDDAYVQNATGENIFEGDSIEILLDTNLQGDFYYDQLSPDDFQLGINPGRPDLNGTREAYLWFPANLAGKRNSVAIDAYQEDGVYRMETAIPWAVFEIDPANGMRFGFVISVSDNDDSGDNVQESMVSSSPGRRLADPTTWGELQLVR